ncbi:hypothetical protein AQV86_01180 [Nanohaloarchaea archaeon SG9]|nr:hypothetical protein AQV86_01180 [Nanohaloarchaea archaeon SG9]
MRQQILETVEQNPGIHFRQVQRELGCSSTTLNHHISSLNVKERNFRGYRRFYLQDISEKMERPLAALNHNVRGIMLYQMQGGISQKELVENFDLSKSTVSSHVKVMREDGVIKEEREGRSKKLFPSESAWKALNGYASQILGGASEGFIEMWG